MARMGDLAFSKFRSPAEKSGVEKVFIETDGVDIE
jgi:hypothetical protein